MPFILTMPKLSPTMEEGVIVKWHKKEGDFVESGDLLLEVTTDKATVEHLALDEGYLRKIIIKDGGEAEVNVAIAVFSEDAKEDISKLQIKEKPPEKIEVKEVSKKKTKKELPEVGPGLREPTFTAEAPIENYHSSFPSNESEDRLKASPLARKIAKEEGLDLSTVAGSGPGGRIVEKDLDMAQKSAKISFGRKASPDKAPGSFHLEPLTPMRKAIGKRLQAAKTFIPHFYLEQIINAHSLIDIKKQLKSYGVNLTFNDFIIRACSLALKDVPAINSGYDSAKESVIRFETVDVAIAVSIEGGLITPIIRHADHKNIDELAREIRSLAKRAKIGKLNPEEYQGGSFTISNLGMFGIDSFSAIINPPQAAILAVGAVSDVPMIKDGVVSVGQQVKMVLSCDHRVIDGADGAKFLASLRSYLENPSGLLV